MIDPHEIESFFICLIQQVKHLSNLSFDVSLGGNNYLSN
jgi:hypothetical protein